MKTLRTLFSLIFASAISIVFAQNPADRDDSFTVTGLGAFNAGGTGQQYSQVTALPGGKVLATGAFYGSSSPAYNRIFRLNNDGSFDDTFNSGEQGASGIIAATAIQPDGKILIGGGFPMYNGVTVNGIARIHQDGSIDNTFDTGTGFSSILPPPWVRSIVIQSDGKIVVGGGFTSFNGTSIAGVVRLNADGSIDNSFDPGSGPNNIVQSVALQADGKILAAGVFGSFNGISTGRIARLNTDGSLDNTFTTATSGDILRMLVQPDGKILTSGANFYRLESDGSLDPGFFLDNVGNNSFNGLALQSDGKIILTGFFSSYLSVSRNHIIRLNTDGTLDMSFDSEQGFATNPNHIALQEDGKIIVFGGYKYKDVESLITRIMGSATTERISDEISNFSDIQIYPNPAASDISIRMSGIQTKEDVNFSLLNLTGQTLKKARLHSDVLQLNLEDLPCGVYLYKVQEGSNLIHTGKIIRN